MKYVFEEKKVKVVVSLDRADHEIHGIHPYQRIQFGGVWFARLYPGLNL